MKKLVGLTIFLMSSFGIFALTENEKIQINLSKKGIDQKIIDETKKLSQEISYKIGMNAAQDYEKRMEELLKKDNRNYIIADKLLEHYLNSSKNKFLGKKGKYAFDSYINSIPFDLEKITMLYIYNQISGNKVEENKYKEIVFSKYKNSWLAKYYNLSKAKDYNDWKKRMQEILKDLDKSRKDPNNIVTDEIYYEYELKYHTGAIREYIKENKINDAVQYYLDNIANDVKTSENVIKYFKEMEILNFNTILELNNSLEENLSKSNLEKLENSRIYKIFSANKR